MNWWQRLFTPKAELQTAADLQDFIDMLASAPSAAGVAVNQKTAMGYQPAASAVLAISELLSILPLKVCQKRQREDIDESIPTQFEIVTVDDHPLNEILGPNGLANSWMNSGEFFELGTRHSLTGGNFVAVKNTARGQVRELIYLPWKRLKVDQNDDLSLSYEFRLSKGGTETFSQDQIFHLRGPLDEDGFLGIDRIGMARDNIGLGIAQDMHASKMFANGAKLAGILEHPAKLTKEAKDALKEQWARLYGGPENAYKTAVLEEGMKFNESSMNAEESQLAESRKLQRSVAAGNWHVPPHMIGDLEHATFSNIENMARQFVDYTLMRSTERWEKAINAQLLTRMERRRGIFVKFDESQLLRGDMEARSNFYQKLASLRAISANEIRTNEGWRPYEGGDAFINPNIETSDEDESETEEPGTPAEAGMGALKRVV